MALWQHFFSLAAISTGVLFAPIAMAQQGRNSDPLVIQDQGSFAEVSKFLSEKELDR